MSKTIARAAILLFTLLVACSAPPTATPQPTLQPVIMAYPPELRPYADALAECARQYPDIAIYLLESTEPFTPDGQTSLFLATGSIPENMMGFHATLLAEMDLVLITHPQNPVIELSPQALRAIWTGKSTNWEDFGGTASPIQVWTYSPGNALRTTFDAAILPGEQTTSQAWLAPDPGAMLEAVSADPAAIGYLPASWLETAPGELTTNLLPLTLPNEISSSLQQPVLALTENAPEGILSTVLLCFQATQ
jgi:DNA-binding transcriptional LysR family regulator